MTAPNPSHEPLFATTRWSVVLEAKNRDSPDSAAALETLCRTYWYPLYALIRGLGHSPHDAQDFTQEFFARLLAKDYLQVVAPAKGRFRTFLRTAVQNFLANEWDKRRAQKRGGDQTHIPFDTGLAEQRFEQENVQALPPDHIYDLGWAYTLLQEAMQRLEDAYGDRAVEWRTYSPYLTADRQFIPYAEIAVALGTTEGAARVAMHRMRKSFRMIFRTTVANTVADPSEIDEEIRYVVAVLGNG